MYKKILKIIGFIFACEFIGIAGSYFTISSIPTWYSTLIKPPFSPPNYLFGPVWTTLYALMGISAYLIWEKGLKKKETSAALKFFIVQLVLNAIWTPVFFGLKELFLALLIIVVMWVFILRTIMSFYRIDKTASYLMIPYLLWVSFATLLNFSIWYLNK
jgi:translocator protein